MCLPILACTRRQIQAIPERMPLSTVTERQGFLARAKADLLDLKREEQELLSKYKEISPLVANVRKEIDLVSKFIIQEQEGTLPETVTTGKNPVYEKLEMERFTTESELKTEQARIEVIGGQIETLDRKLQQINKLQKEVQTLEREEATAQQYYQLYLKKLEEARVWEEMDRLKMSNVSVVQPAVVPLEPIGLTKKLNLLLAVVLGTVAGVGLAFVSEYMAGGYTRPDQAARNLCLPILACIGHKE